MSLINKQHREMIAKYHQGKLSDVQMYQLEMEATNDPFLSDAIDGFEFDANQIGLEHLEVQVAQKVKPKPFFNSFIAPGLILTSALFFLSPIVQKNNESIELAELHTSSELKVNETIIIEGDPISNKEEEVLLNKAKTLPKKLWLENTNPVEIANHSIEKGNIKIVEPVDTEPLTSIKAVIPDQDIKMNKHPVYYLFNLKVANYKDYRSGVLFEQSLLNSVSAQYENSDSPWSTEIDTKKILYTDFLSDCMQDFKNEKFKKAIRGYKTILKHYSSDANAIFYSGLAYYNIGLTEKSIPFLQKSRKHPFNVFNEESDWYLAMAYLKAEETDKCRFILNEIAGSKHFYATRAQLTLKELN